MYKKSSFFAVKCGKKMLELISKLLSSLSV